MTNPLPPVWDYNKPLALCLALNESVKANAALVAYYDLGAERSYSKLTVKLGKKTNYDRVLQRWSSKYLWLERVARAHEIDTEERHKAQRNQWVEAQTEWRHRLAGLASKLVERANEMLEREWYQDKPTRTLKVWKEGELTIEQTIIRQPLKTTPRDAAAYAQAGATIAKLAVGLSDAPAVNLNLTPDDLASMSDEQLAETIAKLREGV